MSAIVLSTNCSASIFIKLKNFFLSFDLKQKYFHPLLYKTKCYANDPKNNLKTESYRVPASNKNFVSFAMVFLLNVVLVIEHLHSYSNPALLFLWSEFSRHLQLCKNLQYWPSCLLAGYKIKLISTIMTSKERKVNIKARFT